MRAVPSGQPVISTDEPSPTDIQLAMRELSAWPGRRDLVEQPPPDGDLATVPGLDPPAFLNDAAKAIWWRVLPGMLAAGRSTPFHLQTLGRYCSLMVLWTTLSEFVGKNGSTYVIRGNPGPDGVAKPNRVRGLPQVDQMLAIGEQLMRMERDMGME